jgi:hypothetical protein
VADVAANEGQLAEDVCEPSCANPRS